MKLFLTLFATVLFFAGGASAQTWSGNYDGSGPAVTSVSQNTRRVAFYTVSASDSTDSDVISVGQCDTFTVEMFESGGSAEAYLMSAVNASKTYTRKILTDVDGGGVDDVTQNGAAGRDAIYDAGPIEHIYLNVTVAPGGSDVVVWKLTCGN